MPQCDHELFVTVVCVVHQDVPENWFAANLDHRFWLEFCVLRKAGPNGPGKNGDFHIDSPPRGLRSSEPRGAGLAAVACRFCRLDKAQRMIAP